MPQATPQKTQDRVVQLYKEGKTYAQIEKETGCRGYLISKIVDKSGLPKRKSSGARSTTAATPASTPAPAGLTSTATPAAAAPTAAADLSEFQPPPPPAPRKTAPEVRAQCDNPACRTIFILDAGETIETVKCPRCGA